MINGNIPEVREFRTSPLKVPQLKSLLEIIIAFLPIIVLGIIGTLIGLDNLPGGALVTLGYAGSILIASISLRKRGSSWSQIGLEKPDSWLRTALLGVGALILLFIMTIALQIIAINLPGIELPPIDQTRFNPLEDNFYMFLLFVVLAWTTIAFGEEMFYRAFLITRFEEIFQKSGRGILLALLSSSLIFGLVHWIEGPMGIANTFFMGLILGAVYLRTGRNLWVTIIAHGLANTVRFYFLFIGAA